MGLRHQSFRAPFRLRPVIAYFSRDPTTAAVAAAGTLLDFPLWSLKRRLRVTIFNGISEVFIRDEVSRQYVYAGPSPRGEYDRLLR